MHIRQLHRASIILLALTGSIVILVILMVVTTALTAQSRLPSDFLPAQSTLLLLSRPTAETQTRFARSFPLLATQPIPSEAEALAILELPGGATGAALFIRTSAAKAPQLAGWHAVEQNPFVIYTSSTAVSQHLTEPLHTLTRTPPFNALAALHQPQHTWLYSQRRAGPVAPLEETLMATLFGGATHLSWREADSDMRIDGYGADVPAWGKKPLPAMPVQPAERATPLLSVHSSQTAQLFQHALQSLPPPLQSVAPGIVQHSANALFGPGISVTYDIVPLLENASAAHLGLTASGAVHVTLAGESARSQRLAEQLEHLHHAFQLSLDTIVTTTRTLNDRFAATDIRKAAPPAPGRITMRDGWQVQTTTAPGGQRSLVTARRGRWFVVSTDAEQFALATPPGGTALTDQRPIAAGVVQPQALAAFFTRMQPPAEAGEASSAWLRATETYAWSVFQNGLVRTVRIQPYASEKAP